MWKSPSETPKGKFCWYMVYYCPRCKRQMTWHTINHNLWKCDMCGLEMIEKSDSKLHLK